jgi:hypothetical protein
MMLVSVEFRIRIGFVGMKRTQKRVSRPNVYLLQFHSAYNFSSLPYSSNCTDGYLKIYLKGQETMDAYDKYDHELCGTEKPHPVVSDGPRLVMVFSSGELQGRGFKVI